MNPPVSPILRVEHIALRVRDLEESIWWYTHLACLAEVTRTGDRVYLAVGDKPTWDISLQEGGSGFAYFSGSVHDEEVLREVADRVKAAGVPVTEVTDLDPGIAAAIEFPLPGGQMMRAVLVEKRSIYASVAIEKNFSAFNGPKELHHINLSVSDIPALGAFLEDHLDMRASDIVHLHPGGPVGLKFWRFNENHHDIGAIGTERDGLHHYAFVVGGVGDLVAIADRMGAHGYPIVENGIGRHGAGNNLFIYVRDPTGNVVEWSSDISRITDRYAPARVWDSPERAGNAWGGVAPGEDFLKIVT